MPLVEVIRGEKTGDGAVAATVAYARKMGKTPIVVNDCPGFLVNRVLFPYFGGFSQLMAAGADFQRVDKVMEKFGWPMGPAYLLDVVGMDTAVHAGEVMAEGFPDRMGGLGGAGEEGQGKSAIQVMFDNDRLGQKNAKASTPMRKTRRASRRRSATRRPSSWSRELPKRNASFPTRTSSRG